MVLSNSAIRTTSETTRWINSRGNAFSVDRVTVSAGEQNRGSLHGTSSSALGGPVAMRTLPFATTCAEYLVMDLAYDSSSAVVSCFSE
jgi:hypothetical protein